MKKAKKIRGDLSKFSGLKTGSPEKMDIYFSRVNSKGGALEDDDSVDFCSTLDDYKDSVEFVESESDGDINKDEDNEGDDEGKNVARATLRDMAKKKTPPLNMKATPSHPSVTSEFSSSTFSKRRDQRKSNKKRSVDEDDDDYDM